MRVSPGIARSASMLVLGLLALLAVGCGSGEEDDPPPAPHGTFYGVAPDGEVNETDYERMSRGGVGTVRVAFAWNAIETEAGSPYDWSPYDHVFLGIAEHRMEPLITVFGAAPKYASDPRTAPTESRGTLEAWGDFLTAASERYGPGGSFWQYVESSLPDVEPAPVRTWEIWNEPNSSTFWQPEPNVDDYAKLLERSAEAIHEHDPDARIMTAGMFATPQSQDAIVSYDFLDELLGREGIEEIVDVVGVHPYGPDEEAVIEQVERTHELIEEAGLDVGVWATEIGWGSDPEMKSELSTTPEEQANLLSSTFGRLFDDRESWDVEGAIWYTWHDPPQSIGACGWCRSAGLLEADRDGKPAWDAYAELAGGSP